MDVMDKLEILTKGAKYDVSCSSSGSQRQSSEKGLGNGHLSGICHSWSSDGRCISLLKILMSNDCVYDCKYCVNRRSHDVQRASFEVEELVSLVINFYKRNYIEGLFISSAVTRNPDFTMERMLEVVRILREREHFNGYIHFKGIPGTDEQLLKRAGTFADRISINLELPSEKSLKLLAPEKNRAHILKPMGFLKETLQTYKDQTYTKRGMGKFMPAGQTTQMMIGASGDSDYQILRLSEGIYNKFKMKRVYYSAYVPMMTDKALPAITTPPLLREHRLYQADWLLRFYDFKAEEILTPKTPNFDVNFDPKFNWAIHHLDLFPVEINRAPYHMLIRVPGIGITSARRIINARRYAGLSHDHLKKMGVVLKRAKFFITCGGKYQGLKQLNANTLKRIMLIGDKDLKQLSVSGQITMESLYPEIFSKER